MTRTSFASALAPVILLALATPALAQPTARASGVEAVHIAPRSHSPIIDRLARNERVYLDRCLREQTWCHVIQLDGGPSGWVPGSYLVGSPAKNAVTPPEFSFDPMDPLDLFPRRPPNFD